MQVTVIIVNFNAGTLLTECVNSVLSSTIPVQVIVSDNGSSDNSIEYLEKAIVSDDLTIIRNKKNLGFSKANNIALKSIENNSDYVLFLNPDSIIQPDTLERMLPEIEKRPEVGMAGCLIRNLDGSEQAGCRRRIPTPWRTLVRTFKLNYLFKNNKKFQCISMVNTPLPTEPTELEAISGAFMLVRMNAILDVGTMDENYFLHCEDLDWFMRFIQHNWKILFVPDVEIQHYKGHCSKNRRVRVEWHKHQGMLRFYRKFFKHQYPFPLMMLVHIAVYVRFLLIIATFLFSKPCKFPNSRLPTAVSGNEN